MAESISKECNVLKKEYDDCFNHWYSEKFLKGDVTGGCDAIFDKYKQCVWKAIKEKKIDQLIHDAAKDAGIPPPKES